jgi:hypothetical protein
LEHKCAAGIAVGHNGLPAAQSWAFSRHFSIARARHFVAFDHAAPRAQPAPATPKIAATQNVIFDTNTAICCGNCLARNLLNSKCQVTQYKWIIIIFATKTSDKSHGFHPI